MATLLPRIFERSLPLPSESFQAFPWVPPASLCINCRMRQPARGNLVRERGAAPVGGGTRSVLDMLCQIWSASWCRSCRMSRMRQSHGKRPVQKLVEAVLQTQFTFCSGCLHLLVQQVSSPAVTVGTPLPQAASNARRQHWALELRTLVSEHPCCLRESLREHLVQKLSRSWWRR